MNDTGREWLVLDRFNQPQGPYTISEVCVLLRAWDFFVCKQGMEDWALARDVPEIRGHQPAEKVYKLESLRRQEQKDFGDAMDCLLQLCRGFLSDDYLSEGEIRQLSAWIVKHQEVVREWPGNIIARRVQQVLDDEIVTDEERADLQKVLEKAAGAKPQIGLAFTLATRLPIDEPAPDISFQGWTFCF